MWGMRKRGAKGDPNVGGLWNCYLLTWENGDGRFVAEAK